MENRQIIDKIVESCQKKIQVEIGGLIGTSFLLTETQTEIVSKEEIFPQLSGNQIFTRIGISGDISGNGHIIISVKDAIRLGGTLIMIPPSELEELIESETYNEETEDSYGEITNIISGMYTGLFEEMYDLPCRFEREEQRLVDVSTAVEKADQFLEYSVIYRVSSRITLNGDQLGTLTLLLPAVPFGLVEDNFNTAQESLSEEGKDDVVSETVDEPSFQEDGSANLADSAKEMASIVNDDQELSEEPFLKTSSDDDVQSRRNDMNTMLESCRTGIQQEVGDIVGVTVTLSEMNNQVITKEQFFRNEVLEKQVATTFKVSGDVNACCYLYLGLKDAIRIGSTLLMLPSNERESAVAEGTFTTDVEDAYDEIAKVISSVYMRVFTEHYTSSLVFEKQDIERVVPLKVDIDCDEPIVNNTYYLNRFKIGLDGTESGFLRMLFPLEMLGLETLQPDESAEPFTELDGENQIHASANAPLSQTSIEDEECAGSTSKKGDGKILILSDANPEAKRIHGILDSLGIPAVQLNFRDNVNDYLPGTFKAVLLVMRDVDEQSLGMAIKINTSCSLPLIATGTSWTRSKVIKAVRYGVNDILLAPATADEISHKISLYLTSLAA